MNITRVRVMAMSDPVPLERRHRTDLGTKVKFDAAIIFVETVVGVWLATAGGDGTLQIPAGSGVHEW